MEDLKNYDISTPQFTLNGINTYARLVDVYDGDTIKILMNYRGFIDLWTLRMNGYDSPEMKPLKSNPNRDKEKEAAKKSKEALMSHFTKHIFIKIVGFDKYGRLLVEIIPFEKTESVNSLLVKANMAVVYDGGTKIAPWII